MEEETKLKMFVWKNVLMETTSGMMVALANNVEEARALLTEECDYIPYDDLEKDPEVYDTPKAVYISGGN